MSQKLWVAYDTPAKTFGPTKVSSEGCSDVDDFKVAIRNNPQLAISPNAPITLYQPDGKTEIKPTDTVKSLGNTGKDGDAPLIVKTSKSNHLGATRQLIAEASCQKYLDRIAYKLSTYYAFRHKSEIRATFGDVLEAVANGKWSHILEQWTYEQEDYNGDTVHVNEGDPRFPVPLPSLYTDEEWVKLKVLYKPGCIHNGNFPMTSEGRALVILPHSDFTEEMISFLKNIGLKAILFSSPDDLDVRDEDSFSK